MDIANITGMNISSHPIISSGLVNEPSTMTSEAINFENIYVIISVGGIISVFLLKCVGAIKRQLKIWGRNNA